MKKYDARLIRTAITAIGIYFLDKCFNNNVKHCRNSLFILLLRVVIFQLSNSTYVLTSLSVATGEKRVYTSFSYQHQTELTDASKSYRCNNTVSFFKLTSLFMLPRLLFNFFQFLFVK